MEIQSPNPNDPITDYSQTQRIVLLVDLNPFISRQNPPNLDRFLSAAKTLLSFPRLSSSLFAVKFFFSSLSLLLSSSRTRSLFPNSPLALSFDRPAPTFESLSQALAFLGRHPRGDGALPDCTPRASCVAASMRQLLHDYAWDPVIGDGTILNSDSVVVRSNLVVMFSSISGSLESLSEFLDVGIEDDCFSNLGAFGEKFSGLFSNVSEAFVSRDIQFSWVTVEMPDKSESGFEFLKSGIRALGWGFCSTDSIVLGSALVPFGLIYPKIGVSPNIFGHGNCFMKLQVQLSLEILDVAKKPLELKCCDLELVDMAKHFPRKRFDDESLHIPEGTFSNKVSLELKKKLWDFSSDGVNNFRVKALHKGFEFARFEGNLSDPVLVREISPKVRIDQKEISDEFFADKVLGMITTEWDDYVPRKSGPIWQILLSFLYREDYSALVSVSDPSGKTLIGILRAFTVSSALLFLTDDVPKISLGVKLSDKNGKKPRRKKPKPLEDQTWDAFCTAAFEHFELELQEVYFARLDSNSKKLRFLKCWMRQISKSSFCGVALEEKSDPLQLEIQKDGNRWLTEALHESEQPISSASAGENCLIEASRTTLDLEFQSETTDTFFSDLSHKIQQGLESEAVELGAFAHRLVNSSIYWLNRKCNAETSESQIPEPRSQDSSGGSLGVELIQLLLKDPKEFVSKGRSSDTQLQTPEGSSSVSKVREHELQILFRMEILQSDIGQSIRESVKQKFVKQICLLLETIQCHLEGGFFGDWSFESYVGKIIKSRYGKTLEDVVNKIYKKMDLLIFADVDELPNRLLISEDSNPSLKENTERNPSLKENTERVEESGENLGSSEPISAEELLDREAEGKNQEEHSRKLSEARERRERARRFTSFTSWVPDLQRVWAPKQPKPIKPKSDPNGKRSKRKKKCTEEIEDTVCETPMSGSKRSQSRRWSCNSDEEFRDSVSKSLFQDDD